MRPDVHVDVHVQPAGRHAHVTAIVWPSMRLATVLTSCTQQGLTWGRLQALAKLRRMLASDEGGR